MTTVYFGPRWDAPMLDDPDDGSPTPVQVETPTGEPCYVCSDPIADGERGLVRAGVIQGPDGQPVAKRLFVHIECEMLGVMGHQFGACRCTGYDTSSRAAALALLDAINAKRAASGMGPL